MLPTFEEERVSNWAPLLAKLADGGLPLMKLVEGSQNGHGARPKAAADPLVDPPVDLQVADGPPVVKRCGVRRPLTKVR